MSPERDNIDDFLDRALKSYSHVEPRLGLESRILANLRTAPIRRRWRMGLVYASAAMVIFCAALYGVWRVASSNLTPVHRSPEVIARPVPPPVTNRTAPQAALFRTKPHDRVRHRSTRVERPLASIGPQLPAARPLSKQEQLLVAFARESPSEISSSIRWQEQMRRPPDPVRDQGEQQ